MARIVIELGEEIEAQWFACSDQDLRLLVERGPEIAACLDCLLDEADARLHENNDDCGFWQRVVAMLLCEHARVKA